MKHLKKLVLPSLFLCAISLGQTLTTEAAEVDTSEVTASVGLTENSDPTVSKLTIAEASPLDFGTKDITVNDLKFKEGNSPKITIEDIRGEANGWKLGVTLGEFTSTSSNTLRGVRLFYPQITLGTNNFDTTNSPTVLAGSPGYEDASITGTEVVSGSSQKTLWRADIGKGNGSWSGVYSTDNAIELIVPAGNLAGQYTADLTYSLDDVPTP